ncbi:gelsolin, cytoplasmic [Cimex lectularius]|uniref:Gelsolin-like domain-containing protein n=1 Tax=Cimex lectularius TaxID=79782 RepID=A0A8I6SQV0_CIMLE|nr:gelsolin, cytoplasmic [Cimex lectularius]
MYVTIWRSLRLPVALAIILAALQFGSAATVANTKDMHPAFNNAGKKDGLEVWRIENFKPVPVPVNDYGKFFEGDSYIVLKTTETKGKKGSFSWDIHYWLGSKTSQDESGAAAILAVQLDDGLGGSPVQHREVQAHESALFQSYFKSGLRYVTGGVASGFHHAVTNAEGEKKLYQVKGKKNVRVRQVQVGVQSMNKGDCFILDSGKDVYVYVGAKAKGTERLKAVSAANKIRDQDHAGRAKVYIIDSSSNEEEVKQFFSLLGSGSQAQIPKEAAVDDDEEFEKNLDATVSLYKVTDSSGKLVSEKLGQKPLKRDMLKPEDCFILDTVNSGIYVWVGKTATSQERVEALKKGQAFLDQSSYPKWTKMQRIIQGAEPTAFKEYFSDWRDSQLTGGLGRVSPKQERNKRSASTRCGTVGGFMPDNGNGIVQVFRVQNFELLPVEEENYGIFFGGDSYVIKYEYNSEFGRKYIIYYWQGKDSTADEKVASAMQAVKLDNELGGRAIQIRVEQGLEPAHFNSLFKGKMVIFMGGHASGFKNLRDYDSYDTDGTRLFRIVGTCANNVRAIQVPEVTESLNTNDAFLLETPTKSYLWMGNNCDDFEKEMAKLVRDRFCSDREAVVLEEGEEPDDFWQTLGGRKSYKKEVDESYSYFTNRLFHCYIKENHKFKIEEISDYQQKDLYPDDVMILDSEEGIYIWIGNDADAEEKMNAYKLAQAYIKHSSREKKVIITVRQGEEPPSFRELFPKWEEKYWEELTSFEDLKNEVNSLEQFY